MIKKRHINFKTIINIIIFLINVGNVVDSPREGSRDDEYDLPLQMCFFYCVICSYRIIVRIGALKYSKYI